MYNWPRKKSLREKVSFNNIARLPKQATEKFREHEILVQMKIREAFPSIPLPISSKSSKSLLNTILGKVLARDSVVKGS